MNEVDTMKLNELDASIQSTHTSLTATITEINNSFTSQFNQIIERFDKLENATAVSLNPGPGAPLGQTGNAPELPLDVLSRWYWVDQATVDAICQGNFDINNLPKLHREENLRNRHSKAVTEGYSIPLNGDPPELILGQTKMHSAFRDLPTFLSAWLVYISICSSYDRERSGPLTYWTERIIYRSMAGFTWRATLNYIIDYYNRHQRHPANMWFDLDVELLTQHFMLPSSSVPNMTNGHHSKSPKKEEKGPLSSQICLNYNRSAGCTVDQKSGNPCLCRHVCSKCQKDTHRAFECPTSKSST